jgi:hypothetical protein
MTGQDAGNGPAVKIRPLDVVLVVWVAAWL